jgi:hypothetical protein
MAGFNGVTRMNPSPIAAMRAVVRVLLVASPLLASGCPFGSDTSDDHPPRLTLENLRAAPETLIVSGSKITAQASVWRDFMPTVPPTANGSELRGVVDLEPVDPGFPASTPSRLFVWVVHGSEVWVGALTHEGEGSMGGQRYTFGGGPRWDTGAKVDVVVGIPSGKQPELIADRAVTIMRTE